ncbi:hypothetical protein Nepgr_025788 [Nepenthes gracilis]|uniref:Knottins-like domain-containing protein n=1 Tax=Nepenthes gracilis TaxID=150966 RepID=A0AAD3T5N0_NEPGR|nr:hypothetical protein Nepgr_025788 [Nepenthes gracilis]
MLNSSMMAKQRRLFSVIFFLVLVLVATENGARVVEGLICQFVNLNFTGPCTITNNCSYSCRTEGFSGVRCRGSTRHCFCLRHCEELEA